MVRIQEDGSLRQTADLEDRGVTIAQSKTIARFVARRFNLLGSSNLETACVEQYIDQIADMKLEYGNMVYSQWDRKYKYVEAIPDSLDWAESALNDDKEYLVNDRLSMADYALFEMLFTFNKLCEGCFESCKNLTAFYRRFKVITQDPIQISGWDKRIPLCCLALFQERPAFEGLLGRPKIRGNAFYSQWTILTMWLWLAVKSELQLFKTFAREPTV